MSYTNGLDKPSDYFETKLWTGNSTDDTAITGLDFAPNWVWIKNRTDTNSHALFDTVRGATKYIESDTSDPEATGATFLKSFTSDGFVLGTGGRVNNNAKLYVSWNWKEQAGVFDIVTYAGNNTGSRQVSHNLGVVPSLIIIKNRTNASSWWVGSTEIPFTWNTDYLQLNEEAAKGTDGGGHIFGAVPTSSYFVPGDNNDTNGNSNNYVAYLFGNKQGVSKVGSYKGNGNVNGSFIWTGQKSAFIMIKRSDVSDSWCIFDNKRLGYNVNNNTLFANQTATENTEASIDFLSNGFKIRGTQTRLNTSGGTYIYMAFAENPFVTSTGVPATAR